MKKLGLYICIFGSVAAIIYPPYRVMESIHWAFIWEDIVAVFGHGIAVINNIDYKILGIELVFINLAGIGLRCIAK